MLETVLPAVVSGHRAAAVAYAQPGVAWARLPDQEIEALLRQPDTQ